MNFKHAQTGKINGGILALIIGGIALAGLLAYGWLSGQELPLWPALAVAAVNLVAAGKIVRDTQQRRRDTHSRRS